METLSSILASGWLVNNLYQHDDGLWRVNLRKLLPTGTIFVGWAESYDLEDALLEAITMEPEPEAEQATSFSISNEGEATLLDRLGLRKAPIKRRI